MNNAISELQAIVERVETVIIEDRRQKPFVIGFCEAIRDRLNKVITQSEEDTIKERRIFVIDLSRSFDSEIIINSLPDDLFIAKAENQGNVYSFEGFVNSWWTGNLAPYDNAVMRIIDVQK